MSSLLDKTQVHAGLSFGENGEQWAVTGLHSEYFIACMPTKTGNRDDIVQNLKDMARGQKANGQEYLNRGQQRKLAKSISDLSTPTHAFRLFVRVFEKGKGVKELDLCVGSPEEVYRALVLDVLSIFGPLQDEEVRNGEDWGFIEHITDWILP